MKEFALGHGDFPGDLFFAKRKGLPNPSKRNDMLGVRRLPFAVCCLGLLVLLLSIDLHADVVVPLERAHSHNDYVRKRPLLDALDHGVCSVEADIFLVDGKLLLGHDLKDVRDDFTLEGVYLEPLRDRVCANAGRVYPNGPIFTLLIDVKSEGKSTYERLRTVLAQYEDMLTRFTETGMEEKAVTVVISGSRSAAQIAADLPRFAACDGTRDDIGGDRVLHPLVSMSWGSVFKWNGRDEMPEAERALLKDMVSRAHANGQRLRFWALPLSKTVWEVLYAEGVDLINVDNLPQIRAFLLEKLRK
jgi:hypothetical protein